MKSVPAEEVPGSVSKWTVTAKDRGADSRTGKTAVASSPVFSVTVTSGEAMSGEAVVVDDRAGGHGLAEPGTGAGFGQGHLEGLAQLVGGVAGHADHEGPGRSPGLNVTPPLAAS